MHIFKFLAGLELCVEYISALGSKWVCIQVGDIALSYNEGCQLLHSTANEDY